VESEKRGTPRIQPFVAACTVHVGKRRFSGYLLDLSTKGARVSCSEPLPRGTESVTLEVRFSRRTASSRLPARVQWAQIGTKKGEAAIFGVTFEDANPEELRVLEDVIAEFQRHAAELA
jgi:hypothetical protein